MLPALISKLLSAGILISFLISIIPGPIIPETVSSMENDIVTNKINSIIGEQIK